MRSLGTAVRIGLVIGLAAVVTDGQPIRKWQTPEGGLYFGENPPPGSVPLGAVGRPATMPTTDAEAEREAETAAEAARQAAEKIRQRRAERRAKEIERAAMFENAVELGPYSVTEGNFGWIVVGVVRNRATERVYDVQIGSGGTWISAEPAAIEAGAEATFRLEVPMYPLADSDALPPIEVRWRNP